MEQTVKKTRSANMDLLRIVSMLLIILLHSIDHSGVLEASETASLPMQLWIRFTYMLVQVSVNCYVLLSGYFLVKSKFRLQKLLILWLETVFYTLIIRIVFIATGQVAFSITSLLSSFIPVFTGRYWFITIYFGLYLVFPFLNIAINAMNKKQHLLLNIVLFILFSVMISLHPAFKGMNSGAGWGLAWFVVLYFIAAYLRLHYNANGKKLRYILVWLVSSGLLAVCYAFVRGKSGMLTNVLSNQYRYDSVFAYISSVCLLLVFVNTKFNNAFLNRIVTFIAPSTLGVYLIHAQADLSPWLWDVLRMPEKMNTVMFPLIQVAMVLGIFAVCILIDVFRRYTIGRLEKLKLIDSFCNSIESLVRGLFSRFVFGAR